MIFPLFFIFSTTLFGSLSNSQNYKNIGVVGQLSFGGGLGYLEPRKLNQFPKIEIMESFETDEDLNSSILFSYSDRENDNINVSIIKNGEIGEVVKNGNYLVYAPNKDANGDDTIILEFDDGFGGVVQKTIAISVLAVNDKPIISQIDDLEFKSSFEDLNEIIYLDLYDDNGIKNISATSSNPTVVTAFANIENNSISLNVKNREIGKATIEIIATDEENLTSKSEFQVFLYPNRYQIDIENTKSDLTFNLIKAENIYQNNILYDLNLIEYLNNSIVSWESSNKNIISNFGEVNQYVEDEQFVKLTATIENNEFTTQKEFLFAVQEKISDDKLAVEKSFEYLIFDIFRGDNLKESEIYSDLNLPNLGFFETSIKWDFESNESEMNLTAIISRNDENISKTFPFIFKEYDKDWLNYQRILGKNKDRYSIISTLNLPEIDLNGSPIVWNSSDESIVSTSGEVHRENLLFDKYILLTAELTINNVTEINEFIIKVLKIEKIEKTMASIKIENNENNFSILSEYINSVVINSDTKATFLEDGLTNRVIFINSRGELKVIFEEVVFEIKNIGSVTKIEDNKSLVSTFGNTEISLAENNLIQYHKLFQDGQTAQIKSKLHGTSLQIFDENRSKFVCPTMINSEIIELGLEIDENSEMESYIKRGDEVLKTTTTKFPKDTKVELQENETGKIELQIETELIDMLEIK
jgi:hypothetical protein